jgi:hypothetical protein
MQVKTVRPIFPDVQVHLTWDEAKELQAHLATTVRGAEFENTTQGRVYGAIATLDASLEDAEQ